MVELLIYAHDQKADTPTKTQETERYHAGDVVDFHPDGWPWTVKEKSHDFFRILQVGLTNIEAKALASQEIDVLQNKLKLWKRITRLDLSDTEIKGEFKTWWEDDSRITPIFKYTGNIAVISDITKIKQPADAYIGGP